MKEERKEPIQIPHIQTINDHISYLTPTEHPLSANVVIIEGDAFFWVYDVGNHPAVFRNSAEKVRTDRKRNSGDFIHFHPDHMGICRRFGAKRFTRGKIRFVIQKQEL